MDVPAGQRVDKCAAAECRVAQHERVHVIDVPVPVDCALIGWRDGDGGGESGGIHVRLRASEMAKVKARAGAGTGARMSACRWVYGARCAQWPPFKGPSSRCAC